MAVDKTDKGRLDASVRRVSTNSPKEDSGNISEKRGKSGPEGVKISPERLKRLHDARKSAWKKMEPFRQNMIESTKQLVGRNYSEDGADIEVPVNMVDLLYTTYVAQLAPRVPRAMVTTEIPDLKGVANDFELALNHQVEQMGLEGTLRQAAANALFGIGVVKVGLASSEEIEIDGSMHDPGQAFVDVVDLHDLVFDMEARRWDQISFIGDRYTLPLEFLKESEEFDKSVTKRLGRDDPDLRGGGNSEGDDKHIGEVSRGKPKEKGSLYDEVEVWDIWLPYEGVVVTVAGQQEDIAPLRVVQWEGPTGGPYHMLRFQEVPGQVMPMPPVGHLIELHKLMNSIWRKLNRQARRQKTYYTYHGTASRDAAAARDASDGELVRLDSAQPPMEVSLRGPDPTLVSLVSMARDLFSYLAGNLDTIGGLGPSAETATQDRMISQSASKKMNAMIHQMVAFTQNIMQDIGLYIWTDPIVETRLSDRVPGTDLEIPVTWSPETREGTFPEYDISVDPYSMADRTPGSELQKITVFMQQYLLPAMPFMAQQGMGVDWEALFRLIAKYSDMRDLDTIIQLQGEPPAADAPEAVGTESGPAVTHRINERINRPGATQEGKGDAMRRALSGENMQPAEADQLVRPVG